MNFFKKHKNNLIYIATVLFSIAFVVIGNRLCTKPLNIHIEKIPTQTAVVTKINDVNLDESSIGGDSLVTEKTIIFSALIKTGASKGETVTATQSINSMLPINPKDVEVRDKILVSFVTSNGEDSEWVFAEYQRSDALIWLCVTFFVLVLLFGRKKGLNTIVSLVFTCLAIFAVFVPAIISGMNIYKASSIICLFIIFMTLLIINGVGKKTFCAAVGCLGGLVVTGILTLVMDKAMNLTGAVDEESIFLVLLNEKNPIDLRAIIFGAIIIGALGATMDISMSIASSLKELSDNMHTKTFKTLVKSGFNIGRDIMGTMANTLILAYIGSSLSIVLLLVANSDSLLALFNREMIVVEVMQSLVGSLGILFTIPITSILSAYIYSIKPRNKKEFKQSDENKAIEQEEIAKAQH